MRRHRDLSTGKPTIERVYLISSLDVFDATPAELAAWIRGHWGIENLLHHVTGAGPRSAFSTTPRSPRCR